MRKLIGILDRVRIWGVRGVASWCVDRIRERRHVRFFLRNAARHATTVPVRGITVIGPLSGGYSLSKTLRDFAWALKRAGVPFQTYDTLNSAKTLPADYADILTPRSEFDIRRYDHVVEMLRSPLPRKLAGNLSRIAFWEGSSGVLKMFPYLAEADSVIAMSDFNASAFRRELPNGVSVHKIPYPLLPVSDDIPSRQEVRRKFRLADSDFVVFYNFDLIAFGRKNPDGVLRAFARAFPRDPGVRLVFKTNHSLRCRDRVDDLNRLAEELGVADRFGMIAEYLSQSMLYGLVNACDAYCSLHRAEGFGIGIAEAMSFAKPVVVTDWSATTEFCNRENALLVPCAVKPVKESEYFAPIGEWAEPDVDMAAKALLKLRKDPEFATQLGLRAKRFVDDYFSIDNFRRTIDSFLIGKNSGCAQNRQNAI